MIETAREFFRQIKEHLPRRKPEEIEIRIDPAMIDFIFNGNIEQENYRPESFGQLTFKAYNSKGINTGAYLHSIFRIVRYWNSSAGIYDKEKERYVKFADVFVPNGNYRRKGIAGKMILEMEEYAEKFGATRIEGIIAPQDRAERSWLSAMYKKLGYEVTREGEGDWPIKKQLKQYDSV